MTWTDVFMGRYAWYRKWKGGTWYRHRFTNDAAQIGLVPDETYWATYGEQNRYTVVIKTEKY